ncbi:MAG: hypothetical protein WB762_10410 [Candidatus Sulfotelmatobacter sp.]
MCASSVVRVGNLEIGGGDFIVIAGLAPSNLNSNYCEPPKPWPLLARTRCAKALTNRAPPVCIPGAGCRRPENLRKAREETGLAIVAEVMSEEDVDLIAEFADPMRSARAAWRTTSFRRGWVDV